MATIIGRFEGVAGGWRWRALPSDRHQLQVRALRDGLVLAGWMTSLFILIAIPAAGRSLGYDAYSYWFDDLGQRYDIAQVGIYEPGAFRYSPPVGLLFSLFSAMPWWLFLWLWSALLMGSLVWLGGVRLPYLLALPPVALELYHGNIHVLLAVAIVLGFRYPVAWSFVLMTKVTPGIGLLWFVVRREWRSLAITLGASAAIAAASYIIDPSLWTDWLDTLVVGASAPAALSVPPPLVIRLPLAALLVVWGARTNRPWTVGISAMLALPNLWPHGLVVGLAALPFLRSRSAIAPRVAPGAPSASVRSAGSYLATVGVTLTVAVVLAAIFAGPLERVIAAASGAIMVAAGTPAPP